MSENYISTEKTKAIAMLIIELVVIIAAFFGVQLDADILFKAFCGIILLITTIYSAWKNHNFTREAAMAQSFLNTLKDKKDD